MRTVLLFFFLYTGFILHAQERCATADYLSSVKRNGDEFRISRADAFAGKQSSLKGNLQGTVIHIPVVVHVLFNNGSQNISDAQIRSGIDALNRDFRRRNTDTVNTPERFQHLAADVQIEFHLATVTPQGRPSTGIERKHTSRMGWMSDDKMKILANGGLDAWDSRSYLNIWICNLIGTSGYATIPGSESKTDGIVINYSAFGTINAAPPFNLGRTAVHEAGHWLGLKHIWGDTQCGDDGVEDTPQQGFYTKGCPTQFRSSCDNNSSGDMYMNYMDYTNDECMNLFTAGQKERMRASFQEGGPRVSLLQSKGLSEPWLLEASLPAPAASLYPNPAQDKITLQVQENQLGKTVQVLTSQGQLVQAEKITSQQQSFGIQQLKPGIYFLKGEGFLYKFIKL